MYEQGQIVMDKVSGEMLVVVEDRDTRVLVTGMSALKEGASLIERAQWVVMADELVAA